MGSSINLPVSDRISIGEKKAALPVIFDDQKYQKPTNSKWFFLPNILV